MGIGALRADKHARKTFFAAFIVGLIVAMAVAYYDRRCVRPRRALYELLGACRDASMEELTNRYYKRLKEPEVAVNGKLVNEMVLAHRVLTSPESSNRYHDEGGEEPLVTASLLPKGASVVNQSDMGWSEEEALARVEHFTDVVPFKLMQEYDAHLRNNAGWSFAGVSNPDDAQTQRREARFWYKPLLLPQGKAHDSLTRRLWDEYFVPLLGNKYDIIRAYANGQTYGIDGSPHRDSTPSPPHFTFLFFPHSLISKGSTDMGGESVFFTDAGNVAKVVPMRANSAVLFPGALKHCGRAPSATSQDLRISVAFKLILKN